MTIGSRVGFIGLGNMGWPMARNLLNAGVPLTVRDLDVDRQRRFVAEHGGLGADEPTAFADVGFVITILPDDSAVREALLEWEGGVAASLPSGTVVVEMSSSNPEKTRLLAGTLADRGVSVIDAPVSGGVQRAEAGTLTIMVGGDPSAISDARPILEVLGERIFHTGPLGSGHAMKALNNFVGGASYAIVVEALAIGQRFGLAPSTMIDVLNASTGRSFNTEVVVKDHVLTRAYATGFAVGLLAKDVGIAANLAASSGVEAPYVALTAARWSDAATGLGAGADHSRAHSQWWSSDLGAMESPT